MSVPLSRYVQILYSQYHYCCTENTGLPVMRWPAAGISCTRKSFVSLGGLWNDSLSALISLIRDLFFP